MLAGFTHAPVVELSERLAGLTGLGHALYGSDGASAVEIALKQSFHFWQLAGRPDKRRFISLQDSYHGETLGALAVTDVPLFRRTYAPLLTQHVTVPSPDARRAAPGESAYDYALRCAAALEQLLAEQGGEIAALIIEPLVQGAAGMAMYDAVYLQRARALCDQYQVHLIADEIAVGFGRTGTLFACEQAGVLPDMMCLSKGLTGGYLPLSVVLCRDAIYQQFYAPELARGFLHSHSYTGNALACRAALATLDLFAATDVLASNRQLVAACAPLWADLAQHPRGRHWRQRGMIWAFDVIDPAPDFAWRAFARGLDMGVLLRPIGDTVYFMPPYVVEASHFELWVAVARAVLDKEA